MAAFEYTYRCPGCRRDTVSSKIVVARHAFCLETGKEGEHLMVLVAINGDSVAKDSDPEPL